MAFVEPMEFDSIPPPAYADAIKLDQVQVSLQPELDSRTSSNEDVTIETSQTLLAERQSTSTVGFIFPFPRYSGTAGEATAHVEDKQSKVPPFFIYHPPVAHLIKPNDGDKKESLTHKAQRTVQQKKDGIKQGTGIAAKAVTIIDKGKLATKTAGVEFASRTPSSKNLKEISLLYPSSYPPEELKSDFDKLLTQIKKSARKNTIVAATVAPFALAFDGMAMIAGPFEICTYWARANWRGSTRATSIIKGVKSEKVPLNFAATDKMDPIIERLQEIIVKRTSKRDKSPPSSPKEDGKYQPGPELADIVLELLREEVGEDLSAYDTDRTRLANDIEGMLQKAAKEWVKTAKE